MLEIQKGDPRNSGVYVAYVEHQFLDKYPEKELLMWHDGYWSHRMSTQKYRGKVYGWVGPLPTTTMDDLCAVSVKYAISIMPDGIHGSFIHGPYENLRDAREEDGEEGQYIFELHLDQESVAIGKWSEKKNKWLRRKK